MCIENDLQAIKRVFIDYPNMYEIKQQELKQVSQERQDLLHVLELGKLNAIEMSKLMRELKDVQVKRRRIKNNLEVLDEIKRYSHKKFKENEVNTLINRVDNIINRERTYTMRVRTDLQELVNNE